MGTKPAKKADRIAREKRNTKTAAESENGNAEEKKIVLFEIIREGKGNHRQMRVLIYKRKTHRPNIEKLGCSVKNDRTNKPPTINFSFIFGLFCVRFCPPTENIPTHPP